MLYLDTVPVTCGAAAMVSVEIFGTRMPLEAKKCKWFGCSISRFYVSMPGDLITPYIFNRDQPWHANPGEVHSGF